MLSTLFAFLFELVLYPVLLVGLVVIAVRVYHFVLDKPCLGLNRPDKARWGVGVLAGIIVLVLAYGRPEFAWPGVLVLLFWVATLGTGAWTLFQHRHAAGEFLRSKFGSCACSPPPQPEEES
jgi:hypothetical protein